MKHHDSASSREESKPYEDGAPEIEITLEMIEAGSSVVAGIFDGVIAYGSETSKLTAIEVYSAMERARFGSGRVKR